MVKKILFIPFNLMSHLVRSLTLAKSIQNEFEIVFLTSKDYTDYLSRYGFSYRPNRIDEQKILKKVKSFDFSWLKYKNIELNFSYLISEIEKINPDLVISDSNIFVSSACEYLKIPHISLVNSYMTRYFTKRYTDISYLGTSLKFFLSFVFKLLPESEKSKILQKGEKVFLKKFHAPFKVVRRKYGLKQKEFLFEEFEGDLTFLLDPKQIFPVVENPNAKVVGPVYYFDDNLKDNDNLKPSKDKPTILITLGSSGDIRKIYFLERLKLSSTYNIILLGGLVFPLKIDKAQRIKYVNISQIAEYVDVVICHGGNGTVYSFLSKGVPSIMFPSHIEQFWFAYQIHKQGLGVLYDKKMRLNDVIEELIEKRRNGFFKSVAEIFDVKNSVKNFKTYLAEFFKN